MLSKAEPRAFESDHGVYGSPGDVAPWDVRFDVEDRAFFDTTDTGGIRIRVHTDPRLGDGLVVVRSGASVLGLQLDQVWETSRFRYWETVVDSPAAGEFSLAFRTPAGQGVYVGPTGVANAIERLDRWPLEAPEYFDIPDWATGAVIYQIFPDRFNRGGDSTRPDLQTWGEPAHRSLFHGGDLEGVTEKLRYLEDLGVDAIYLNPIFSSPSNHRYDTVDYYEVDDLLGGNQAFRDLVKAAHSSSIRVILDASFNHVHPQFFAFSDVMEHGPRSEYWDWFVVNDWPVNLRVRSDLAEADTTLADYISRLESELGIPMHPTKSGRPVQPSYESWYGVPTMPRVNLANPGARRYMLDVAAHWLSEYDIDGWRMDVVRYVDTDFWVDFRNACRAAKPDCYLLAETVGDSSLWLQGDRFDATMNYSFRELCIQYFANEDITGDEMLDWLTDLWAMYGWAANLANQNLLGSHDTARFLTVAGGEVWRLRLATALQMTAPGAPGLYYGDEVEMTGDNDPDCRGGFPWDSDSSTTRDWVTELTALRSRHPALRLGEWRPLSAAKESFVFERRHGGDRVVVAINRGETPEVFAIGGIEDVLLGSGSVTDDGLVVAGRSVLVVR